MKNRLLLPFAAVLAFAPLVRGDNEIGFIEKFALAPDREAVLGQLIPGSEEFYFFSALHFQNTKQKAKLAALSAVGVALMALVAALRFWRKRRRAR